MKIKPTKMTTSILSEVINEKPYSIAHMYGDNIEGTVCFYPYKKGTILIYEISGLPKGKECEGGIFGFHIHDGESCENNTKTPYEKSLGHYNPNECGHPYHLGDLPPLFAKNQTAWAIIYIDKFQPRDVMGRTIIIHEHFDDFHSQPSGNSGMKIACGIIREFK